MIRNIPLWKRRISVFEAIYKDLILGVSLNTLDPTWLDFEKSIFNAYLENKNKYLSLINDYLKSGWEVDRINLTATAILLEALSEFYLLKTPKNVLISQSVKTAKNYCGEDEFKLVNGILENIFNDLSKNKM